MKQQTSHPGAAAAEAGDEIGDLLRRGNRYAWSLTHETARAEDLLQDVCLAVVQAGGRWERAYLFSAIRTRHLNQVRRLGLVAIDPVEDIEKVSGDLDQALDIETEVLAQEEMDAALASLQPAEREAVYLARVEGYTAREIAELTERPRGTILSLVHRARKKLRRFLESTREGATA